MALRAVELIELLALLPLVLRAEDGRRGPGVGRVLLGGVVGDSAVHGADGPHIHTVLVKADYPAIFLRQREPPRRHCRAGHSFTDCLLYTSDAADEEDSVAL